MIWLQIWENCLQRTHLAGILDSSIPGFLQVWCKFVNVLGDTEDDLDHKKDSSRPKRSRPVAEAASASTRPSSSLSGASTASAREEERRGQGVEDSERRTQAAEDTDGKHSPDSQKSSDDKTGLVH